MSSQSDNDANFIFTYTIENACKYSVLTLLTCEWIFTIRSEIGLFWSRRLSGPTILFVLNRYITLVNAYLEVFAFSTSIQGCTTVIQSYLAVNFLQFFPATVFSTLRVYALGHSWFLSSLVFILSNAPMVVNYVNSFGVVHATGTLDRMAGCVELEHSDGPGYWPTASILISRISIIVVDVVVLVVTWLATYKKGLIKGGAGRHSLLFVMLYNGTCYFLVILIFNIFHIALSFASPEIGYNGWSFTSNVTAFIQPITNILIARFLIDLQATNRTAMNINGPGTSHSSWHASQQSSTAASDVDSLRFAGFIGSIGSVLTGDLGRDDIEDVDEEHSGPGETQLEPAHEPGSQRSIPGDELAGNWNPEAGATVLQADTREG